MTFADLFIQHAVASFDKQIYFDAMLGKSDWAFDLNSGVLAFRRPHEDDLQLNVQVIGTESEDSNTWLWAWSNTESHIPDALLRSVNELKALGEAEGIPELTMGELPITPQVNPYRLMLVANGVCRGGAYFRAKYPRGALHLLIKDARYKRSVTKPIPRILRVFPMFLSDIRIDDQRAAFIHYLSFYRLHTTENDKRVIATSNTAPRTLAGGGTPQQLAAEFDEQNRLVSLQ